MVDAQKLAHRLIALKENAGALYRMASDLLDDLEAAAVCLHPEKDREYTSPFGAHQAWTCKRCGYEHKDGDDAT